MWKKMTIFANGKGRETKKTRYGDTEDYILDLLGLMCLYLYQAFVIHRQK